MSTFRVMKNPDNPYVMINKVFLNDEHLSWKAKGLLTYLLSLPDDWQIYETELTKHSKDGKDSTKTTIKELIDNGYIERLDRVRDSKGRLSSYNYNVYETNNNHNGLSYVGMSNVGKADTSNNNLTYNDDNNILLDCTNRGVISKVIEYIESRTDEPMRKCYAPIDLSAFDDVDWEDIETFLDDNIQTYDQCNLDYIATIQYRLM